ncbi:uncharacterized protein VP01_1076g2 [Puccinia sorghi]|uniref:Uncharacterized protein n=1 Tax=Puccinia sorghi TaxID=27349 RepID=A0A0L6VTH4_9BASI|nr:uncharacterized protein VP01_1076g2 [Puccinia sorghi]
MLLKLASLNGTVAATHTGSIRMLSTHSLTRLDNVLYCPDICETLISLWQLLDNGFKVFFDKGAMLITDERSDKLFFSSQKSCFPFHACCNEVVWRLAVIASVAQSVGACISSSYQGLSVMVCSKLQHQVMGSFLLEIPSKEKGDLVVTDVLGPVDPADIFGNQYILTLRDHATTFLYCFLLKSRVEVETKLQHALTIIKTQSGAPKFL